MKRFLYASIIAGLSACIDSAEPPAAAEFQSVFESALFDEVECFATFEIDFPSGLELSVRQNTRQVFLAYAGEALMNAGFARETAFIDLSTASDHVFMVSSLAECNVLIETVQVITRRSFVWLSEQESRVADTNLSASVSRTLDDNKRAAFYD